MAEIAQIQCNHKLLLIYIQELELLQSKIDILNKQINNLMAVNAIKNQELTKVSEITELTVFC
jgi:hypothetical protein